MAQFNERFQEPLFTGYDFLHRPGADSFKVIPFLLRRVLFRLQPSMPSCVVCWGQDKHSPPQNNSLIIFRRFMTLRVWLPPRPVTVRVYQHFISSNPRDDKLAKANGVLDNSFPYRWWRPLRLLHLLGWWKEFLHEDEGGCSSRGRTLDGFGSDWEVMSNYVSCHDPLTCGQSSFQTSGTFPSEQTKVPSVELQFVWLFGGLKQGCILERLPSGSETSSGPVGQLALWFKNISFFLLASFQKTRRDIFFLTNTTTPLFNKALKSIPTFLMKDSWTW